MRGRDTAAQRRAAIDAEADLRLTPTFLPASGISESVPGGYRLGQNVRHAKFGDGTILSFDGSGERTQVEVRFKNTGTKRLLLSMAKLERT